MAGGGRRTLIDIKRAENVFRSPGKEKKRVYSLSGTEWPSFIELEDAMVRKEKRIRKGKQCQV